jgi:hypothetical protein
VDLYRGGSRHRFVYPTFKETTARAIEACEAAWAFFGSRFQVLISDNTKAIIVTPDPLAPLITPAFLEYAQARELHIDAAGVRHALDNIDGPAALESSARTANADQEMGASRRQIFMPFTSLINTGMALTASLS